MKPLPLHAIPTSRMASLTLAAQRQQRATRHEQRTLPGWTEDDKPAASGRAEDGDTGDGCGSMAVVAMLVLLIFGYIAAIIFFARLMP